LLENSESGEVRAKGIIYVKDGQERKVAARHEIILSAGSIGTPQILMLSGIGPENHLKEMKVEKGFVSGS